ncbi:tyrosine-type recombinase/integrase [Salipiger manganoxidans]|uniref:tyrosine-type recombinase/integrase n=1 Tax=Salipiger marinus TaxID=555512 RepID=UPI001E4C3E57|nr:tyrosine-type recombinase/integrase [Salipiger manganoxidans]MCD1620977.1 tyrosine-type recombinase/integrase [Salipiger manganoxidans]
MANPWTPIWNEKHAAWAIDFRVGSRRIRRRLPIGDESQRKTAEKLAEKIYHSAWQDELQAEQTPRKTSFVKAAELYEASGGEARFLPKLKRYFGRDTFIEDIDEVRMMEAAAALYPEARPDTIRRQVRVPIRSIQNFAAGKRRQKSTDTRRVRWLSPNEAETMIHIANDPDAIGLRDPRRETLRKIAFMLGTGAGPGETMALDGKGWNPTTREWWLPGTKTTFRPRFVFLPRRAIDLVGEIPAAGPAFPAPNGHPYKIHPNRGAQMAVAFGKVRDAAGLGPDVVPYTLRHTWATWFYAQTKDWAALLDHGGWGRSDTANRYRKIAPKDLANQLLAYGWDFRPEEGEPVRFGELISVRFSSDEPD